MSEVVEAEVAFGDAKITIRGPQEFVKSEVTRLAGLVRSGQTTAIPDPPKGAGVDIDGMAGAQNEREFIALKSPKGHSETATVLGFWLMVQGASEFSEDDIRRAYIRAGVRPPKVVSQALRDAKRALDSITQGSKRGMYRLTPHGDRVVRFDLPRRR
jgi:hypothetical protein